MFPLFSILRREKNFATQPHQFVLLHLKRLHLMEWVCPCSELGISMVGLQKSIVCVSRVSCGPVRAQLQALTTQYVHVHLSIWLWGWEMPSSCSDTVAVAALARACSMMASNRSSTACTCRQIADHRQQHMSDLATAEPVQPMLFPARAQDQCTCISSVIPWSQVRAVMGTTLSTPKDAPLPPILMQQETDSVWGQPGEA